MSETCAHGILLQQGAWLVVKKRFILVVSCNSALSVKTGETRLMGVP